MFKKILTKILNFKKSKKETDFYGEHFEGHGGKWEAFFGSAEKFIKEKMVECIQEGSVVLDQNNEKRNFHGLVYPNNQPISVLSLIEVKKKENEFTSACPLMTGYTNEVRLLEYYSWETPCEGEFAAETKDEKIINFFDPFYAVDRKKFQKGKMQNISLAGLALNLEKLEEQEFKVEKGGFYEVHLKEFLEKNPDKTEADFEVPSIKISADTFRMLMPTQYACEFEIATSVEEIEYINVLGENFAKMKVNFEHTKDDKFLYCNIYASEHVLKGYKPQVGDGISAIIWLTGYFE